MSVLLFLDTETTGLSLEDDIWEFAAIRRETNGTQTVVHLFIEHDRVKCERLPELFRNDHLKRWPHQSEAVSQEKAAEIVAILMADRPHIVGAVPNFDTERLALLLRRFGHEPGWHYHLIDVETMTMGFLAAAGKVVEPPWDSDELAQAIGVEPPAEGERHTAMGDALWAMRTYDMITKGAPMGVLA